MRTQQEGGHLQVKEWPQRKANLLTPFGFQPPKQREDVSGIQASQCTALCYGGLSRLRTGSIGLGPTLIQLPPRTSSECDCVCRDPISK